MRDIVLVHPLVDAVTGIDHFQPVSELKVTNVDLPPQQHLQNNTEYSAKIVLSCMCLIGYLSK